MWLTFAMEGIMRNIQRLFLKYPVKNFTPYVKGQPFVVSLLMLPLRIELPLLMLPLRIELPLLMLTLRTELTLGLNT